MKEIDHIDYDNCVVYFNDGTTLTQTDFNQEFTRYFQNRIAGETISPMDMERFSKRSGGKILKDLRKLAKNEGYLEASVGKPLSKKAWNIITIVMIVIIIMIVLAILKNMGILNF